HQANSKSSSMSSVCPPPPPKAPSSSSPAVQPILHTPITSSSHFPSLAACLYWCHIREGECERKTQSVKAFTHTRWLSAAFSHFRSLPLAFISSTKYVFASLQSLTNTHTHTLPSCAFDV